MVPIHPDSLSGRLAQLVGQRIYIHLEVNPGAYWRNGAATLVQAHLKGDGPYRIFLELDDKIGLIQVDNLTHMQLDHDLVICTGYDDQERLARTVEISTTPFPM